MSKQHLQVKEAITTISLLANAHKLQKLYNGEAEKLHCWIDYQELSRLFSWRETRYGSLQSFDLLGFDEDQIDDKIIWKSATKSRFSRREVFEYYEFLYDDGELYLLQYQLTEDPKGFHSAH
jgi:hypothetical protein